jgi:glutamate N-acetyltransferase/amino-acid N-acetyltransferase
MAHKLPIPHVLKRFSSAPSPTIMKPTPSKAHLHQPIPSSSFPSNYLLTGIHTGIKHSSSKPDVGIILSTSPYPTSAAACFTRNAFKAAPVLVSGEVLERGGGRARAVVVNSGCANAVTGKKGLEDAWSMVRETDALLRHTLQDDDGMAIGKNETLVMSTGVIGQNLPISKIIDGIRSLSPSPSPRPDALGSDFPAWERTAQAFMTTDTFPKLRARTFILPDGKEYRIAGIDKGAGMIHPDMGPGLGSGSGSSAGLHATLLGCILTDCAVSPRSLQSALTYAVERSFNSISVDGDMSTNDTIIALANGAAATAGVGGNGKVVEIDEEADRESFEAFKEELTKFAVDLAKLVVRDGEGATKFVTVTVDVSSLASLYLGGR